MRDGGDHPPRESLAAHAGNTPLVRLGRSLSDHPGVDVYVKLDWLSPFGAGADDDGLRMARELYAQTGGRITHLVGSAHIVNLLSSGLRALGASCRCLAAGVVADTAPSAPIEGDDAAVIRVTEADAHGWADRLGREEGLRIGPQAAVSVAVVARLANGLSVSSTAAVIVALVSDPPGVETSSLDRARPPVW